MKIENVKTCGLILTTVGLMSLGIYTWDLKSKYDTLEKQVLQTSPPKNTNSLEDPALYKRMDDLVKLYESKLEEKKR